MTWTVLFFDEFEAEFWAMPEVVREALLAQTRLLKQFGPQLGRPRVDTLKGSSYANMKELRFEAADGVWRVAFVFDPTRTGVFLVAGDKSGVSEKMFYKRLIAKADERLERHLKRIKGKV